MRRVVAVANAKGGVGKTSVTAGLAGLAAQSGRRVLTIDADPQGNLSLDLGYPISDGQGLALAIQSGCRSTRSATCVPTWTACRVDRHCSTSRRPTSHAWRAARR